MGGGAVAIGVGGRDLPAIMNQLEARARLSALIVRNAAISAECEKVIAEQQVVIDTQGEFCSLAAAIESKKSQQDLEHQISALREKVEAMPAAVALELRPHAQRTLVTMQKQSIDIRAMNELLTYLTAERH